MKKLAIASALLSAVALTGTAAHAYQVEVGASAGLTTPDIGTPTALFVLMAHTTLIQLKHVMHH